MHLWQIPRERYRPECLRSRLGGEAGILRDHVQPMNHVSPDGSSLFHDDNVTVNEGPLDKHGHPGRSYAMTFAV